LRHLVHGGTDEISDTNVYNIVLIGLPQHAT